MSKHRRVPARFKQGHHIRTVDQKGEKNRYWKGGRTKHEGYSFLYIPGHPNAEASGYVREHIHVYQEYYRCCMLDWGEIHHINEQRDDNRIENLQGMTSSQHSKLSWQERHRKQTKS